MQQIKVFRASTIQELEQAVNDWLRSEPVSATTISLSEDDVMLTMAILYSPRE